MARRLTREESRARTRQRVLDAAEAIFAERGYQEATVESIAERAGYSIGALYSNFTSKAHLLSDVVARRDAADQAAVGNLLGSADSLEEAARAVGRREAEHSDEAGVWLLLAWQCRLETHGGAAGARLVSRGSSDRIKLLGRAVQGLLDRHGAEPPISPDQLAVVLTALVNGLVQHRAQFPDDVPDQLFSDALALVARAIHP